MMLLMRTVMSVSVCFMTDPKISNEQRIELFFARALHVMIIVLSVYVLFVSEKERREKYVTNYAKQDLRRGKKN